MTSFVRSLSSLARSPPPLLNLHVFAELVIGMCQGFSVLGFNSRHQQEPPRPTMEKVCESVLHVGSRGASAD